MAAIRNVIGRALYPENAVCLTCGTMRVDRPEWGLCAACAEKLVPLDPPLCSRCGAPEVPGARVCPECYDLGYAHIDACYSAYAYAGTARGLVRALKYSSVASAANALADGMAQLLPTSPFDAIVPVPLHKNRLRRRGFNQADVLSEALSARISIPILNALARERATKTQTQMNRDGREANVRDAFVLRMAVQDRVLLLVDDVLTTGATASSCAETLKTSGAASVVLLTAARAAIHADD